MLLALNGILVVYYLDVLQTVDSSFVKLEIRDESFSLVGVGASQDENLFVERGPNILNTANKHIFSWEGFRFGVIENDESRWIKCAFHNHDKDFHVVFLDYVQILEKNENASINPCHQIFLHPSGRAHWISRKETRTQFPHAKQRESEASQHLGWWKITTLDRLERENPWNLNITGMSCLFCGRYMKVLGYCGK